VSVAAAIIVSVAVALNLVSVALLRRWASWMYDQRRRGYPDERALRLDRRSVWIGVAAGWVWANVIMGLGAAVAASRFH
jgi:uncharacterized membrane protein YbjE (DUF340 family)